MDSYMIGTLYLDVLTNTFAHSNGSDIELQDYKLQNFGFDFLCFRRKWKRPVISQPLRQFGVIFC